MAPEPRYREGPLVLAEVWRAESYMKMKNIRDSEKVEWFVRGSNNKVIDWYVKNSDRNKEWKIFKEEYIKTFGTKSDIQHYLKGFEQGSDEKGLECAYRIKICWKQ